MCTQKYACLHCAYLRQGIAGLPMGRKKEPTAMESCRLIMNKNKSHLTVHQAACVRATDVLYGALHRREVAVWQEALLDFAAKDVAYDAAEILVPHWSQQRACS